MPLGQRIRQLRDEKDFSLREFAKKLDCSAAFISDIELGRRYPSEKVLQDIARLLEVKVEDLKTHDTRPPVEEMKRRIAVDPRYALAFRTMVNRNISPDDLLKLAKSKDQKDRARNKTRK